MNTWCQIFYSFQIHLFQIQWFCESGQNHSWKFQIGTNKKKSSITADFLIIEYPSKTTWRNEVCVVAVEKSGIIETVKFRLKGDRGFHINWIDFKGYTKSVEFLILSRRIPLKIKDGSDIIRTILVIETDVQIGAWIKKSWSAFGEKFWESKNFLKARFICGPNS